MGRSLQPPPGVSVITQIPDKGAVSRGRQGIANNRRSAARLPPPGGRNSVSSTHLPPRNGQPDVVDTPRVGNCARPGCLRASLVVSESFQQPEPSMIRRIAINAAKFSVAAPPVEIRCLKADGV